MPNTHIKVNQPQSVFFDTQLSWMGNKNGALHAHGVQGTIYLATPLQFGGEGHEWSPEHLLLGALSSCYMTTFLFFAGKLQLPFSNFSCAASGEVALVNGKYEFSQIDLFPDIHIMDESLRKKTEQVLQKTQQHCLISRSLACAVHYNNEIHIGFRSKQPASLYEREHIM